MENCGTCRYFNRGKWDKSICSDESEQLGGHCSMILDMLKVTNSKLWMHEELHVHESFGCTLYKDKDEDD